MAGRFLMDLAHTEHGAKLELTREQEENCRVVYRRSEKEPDTYVFDSLWNPDADYSDEHIIVPLRSTYKGLSEEYDEGTCFANIIDSSRDPKYPGSRYPVSWIEVLRRAYRKDGESYCAESCCAKLNTIYSSKYPYKEVGGFACTNHGLPDPKNEIYIVGAHVMMEAKQAQRINKGDNVYLLPLCDEHNRSDICGNWGVGYFMELGRPMKAAILEGYMNDPTGPIPI